MLKRWIAVLLVLIMSVPAVAACGNAAVPGTNQAEQPTAEQPPQGSDASSAEPSGEGAADSDTLIWRMRSEPRSLDPQRNYSSDGSHIIQNTYEGLYAEKIGGIEPSMAKSYDVSEDGCTYTFHLRDGVKWSDGQPLTASDFEYSWKRLCNPDTAATTSFMMTSYIKGAMEYLTGQGTADDMGVKAVDDATLVVELKNPVPFFVNLTTFYSYFPARQDIIEKYGDGWDKNPQTSISNGPFKLEEYHTGSHIVLTKNDYYWNAENVKIERIKGLMLGDASTALNGYEAGEIDVMQSPPQDEITRLKAEDPNLMILPAIGTFAVNFNVDSAPTNDLNVRKALTLAIDRKRIVEQVTKGGEIAASGYIPSAFTFSDGKSFRQTDEYGNVQKEFGIDPSQAQVEEARACLAEAGYPDGQGFPKIEYLYDTDEGSKKLAEAMQAMWKENLNIDVALRNEDRSVFNENTIKGNYNISKGGWWADYYDTMSMFDTFLPYSGNNKMQWRWNEQPVVAPHDHTLNPENKELDDAISMAQSTTGAERDQWLKKAEQVVMENFVVAPIYYYTDVLLVNKNRVEGVGLTPVGFWCFKGGRMMQQ